MGEDCSVFKELFGLSFDSTMMAQGLIYGDGGTIIEYEQGELYNLLMAEGLPIPSINQVMKLYEMKYPLTTSKISTLSTDELREIVKHNSFLKKGDKKK